MPCVDMYKVPNALVSPAAMARTNATHSCSEVREPVSTLLRSPPRVGAASRSVTAAASTFTRIPVRERMARSRESCLVQMPILRVLLDRRLVLNACFARVVNQTTSKVVPDDGDCAATRLLLTQWLRIPRRTAPLTKPRAPQMQGRTEARDFRGAADVGAAFDQLARTLQPHGPQELQGRHAGVTDEQPQQMPFRDVAHARHARHVPCRVPVRH